MFGIIRIFVIGIIVGMANVIPGVSGGTLAVVFNIYDKFVNAITFNVKKLWANKRFVVPLLVGMALGVLILSKIITKLYERFPFQTNCFFTGLVLGSIPLLLSLVLKRAPGLENQPKYFTVPRIIGMVICAVAGFAVLIFFDMKDSSMSRDVAENMILPAITFPLVVRIFVAGVIGAVAMIIPGISGSLLMLMMGVYTIIISSIPALFVKETMFHAFFLLLPNGIGVLIGLLCGAKLISYLLKKAPHQTYSVIFGLICGSVLVVFPGFREFSGAVKIISGIICIIAGAAMAYFSSKFEPKDN
ncbi:MAG: DUF368 domain-containing protein [Treponema sp.]|nr:DUF368 domain-containing protein [Treponema sp.]